MSMATNGNLNVFLLHLSMQMVLIGGRWAYFKYPVDISIHTRSEDYILRNPDIPDTNKDAHQGQNLLKALRD